MRLQYGMTVELDSGETYDVSIDQRDFAALEAAGIADGAQTTKVRYVAWNASKRTGRYTGSWEQFNTHDCVEAADREEPAAGTDSLDPGRVDQNAAA